MGSSAQSGSELHDELERLLPPSHACVTYRGQEEQLALGAAFMAIGLERGERCVFIDPADFRPELLGAMQSAGVDVDLARRSGALAIVPGSEAPAAGEPFFNRALEWFGQLIERARGEGYPAVRVVAEMTWTLGRGVGVEEVAEFESRLNAFLASQPALVLCPYDRDRFPPAAIREQIAVHPLVIVEKTVCHNPYHVPPERYLAQDWRDREVDWILANLVRLQRAENGLRQSEERYRALAQRLIEAQEDDRKALARELHDEVGQTLTALGFALKRAGRFTPSRRAELVALVDQAVEQVRTVALGLRPPALDILGLPAALRTYLGREGHRLRLDVHLSVVGSFEERLPPRVEVACFRLVQEALTNVVRHSGARRVDIELRRVEGAVEIAFHDDGKGFDAEAVRERAIAGKHLGLIGMEERVSLAGGRLEIESAPGHGTMIRARFSVPSA